MLAYAELSRREGTAIPRSPDFTRETRASNVLDLVNLTQLMELTSGRPEIVIGLVDGPVVIGHPDLAGENVLIWQVKTFARFPGGSAARVLKPAVSHACTEPLSLGSSARREAPPRRLSAQAAPCSCVRFFLRRQWPKS